MHLLDRRLNGAMSLALACALVLAVALPAFAAPASRGGVLTGTGARSAVLVSDDETAGAVTLPVSPAKGSLNTQVEDERYDDTDYFKVDLPGDSTITVTLRGSSANEYLPILTSDANLADIWESWGEVDYLAAGQFWYDENEYFTYPQSFTYHVPAGQGGKYYVGAFGFSGSGAYTITWSVTDPGDMSGEIERFAGTNRFDTANRVSASAFTSATTVVVATGRDYADALAAAGLCGAYDAPLLLTEPGSLPGGLLTEIDRLTATDVIIVGGTGAVSTTVENALKAHDSLDVTRVAGVNRYDTSRKIAEMIKSVEASSFSGQAFVVSGAGFADALAVSPFAYSRKMPILLTRPGALPAETIAALSGIETVTIAGGGSASGGAVWTGVENALRTTYSLDVTRVAGANRYETAVKTAEFGFDQGWTDYASVGIATGYSYADALGGGVAQGARGGVLLLTPPHQLDSYVNTALQAHLGDIAEVNVFGGVGAVTGVVTGVIDALLKAG